MWLISNPFHPPILNDLTFDVMDHGLEVTEVFATDGVCDVVSGAYCAKTTHDDEGDTEGWKPIWSDQ